MVTKTPTIMEDVYDLLRKNKRENESFSEEIRRVLAGRGKKSLMEFFGILGKEAGNKMMQNYKKIRKNSRHFKRISGIQVESY
ncbi:antitoxin VapB family protein [Candidatus Woesearchaeota archaeon]|nr:antitoxin VapB family protein [Candidatus Woesearchaeota archaeon]